MASRKRKICFVTERRADYSRLKPIMREVQKSKKMELQLIVTGAHLLKNLGETKKILKDDGFKADAIIPMFKKTDADDGASMVRAMARFMANLPSAFERMKPDIVFSGFDLGANLAAAITGMHMNIHVSHIQGGEVSGTVDEVLRHACTKFSHLHFAATDESVKRIIKMGEDSKYVYNVGSPSLNTIKTICYYPKEKICKMYGINPAKKLLIFIQHPVTTEEKNAEIDIRTSIRALKNAIKKHDAEAIAIYSNIDAGGKRIIKELQRSAIKVFPHIVYEDFLRLMKVADALVGNSSTGIHETPSFGLPTVNIGTRQQHRERGANIIDVPNDAAAIEKAINKALTSKAFIARAKRGKNPYDNGDTAKKIVKVLETVKLPPIQKVITY